MNPLQAAWARPRRARLELLLRLLSALALQAALALGCASKGGGNGSAQPYSGENEGPGATETNFFTIPCGEDADCGDGRRCVEPEGAADAGPPMGHCED